MDAEKKTLKERYAEVERIMTTIRADELKIRQAEDQVRMNHYNDNVSGKLYYGDETTASGMKDCVHIIRPIRCNDWSMYNVCVCTTISVQYKHGGEMEVRFVPSDNVRVDLLGTSYKECTKEKLDQLKTLLSGHILSMIESVNVYEDVKKDC